MHWLKLCTRRGTANPTCPSAARQSANSSWCSLDYDIQSRTHNRSIRGHCSPSYAPDPRHQHTAVFLPAESRDTRLYPIFYQCCFTSAETVQNISDGKPQDVHLDIFHTAPSAASRLLRYISSYKWTVELVQQGAAWQKMYVVLSLFAMIIQWNNLPFRRALSLCCQGAGLLIGSPVLCLYDVIWYSWRRAPFCHNDVIGRPAGIRIVRDTQEKPGCIPRRSQVAYPGEARLQKMVISGSARFGLEGNWGAGLAQWLERRTRDQKTM